MRGVIIFRYHYYWFQFIPIDFSANFSYDHDTVMKYENTITCFFHHLNSFDKCTVHKPSHDIVL